MKNYWLAISILLFNIDLSFAATVVYNDTLAEARGHTIGAKTDLTWFNRSDGDVDQLTWQAHFGGEVTDAESGLKRLAVTDTEISLNRVLEMNQSQTLDAPAQFEFDGSRQAAVLRLPIPATAWLFGTALVGFVIVSRRRNPN